MKPESTRGPLTMKEIAEAAEVRLSAVSNWRVRHPDFPSSRIVSGQEVFEREEVVRWLQKRSVPRNRLNPDEEPGVTYGDRAWRNLYGSPLIEASEESEAQLSRPLWEVKLWSAVDVLRRTHDMARSLELLIGLIYLRVQRIEDWQSIVSLSDWAAIRDLLSSVRLSAGNGAPMVRVFRELSDTVDPSLIEVISLVDQIDLDEGGSRNLVTGRIAEVIFDNLERGLGKSGGYFTPPDVARCLIELLGPNPDSHVYDPFCGSGELLCAAAAHVNAQGPLQGWHAWGQTPHEWSWLMSRMNLALHGVDADLGVPGNVLQHDQFPWKKFDCIVANPPFNLNTQLSRDQNWPAGKLTTRDANFAWLQHALTKLKPGGRAAVVMPEGAGFHGGRVSAMREKMIRSRVVECIISLPPGLFRFTGVRVAIWILRATDGLSARQETLFIDAADVGGYVDRARRRLSDKDVDRIVRTYRNWLSVEAGTFDGSNEFARAVTHDEISDNGYILAPGQYVGPAEKPQSASSGIAELSGLKNELDTLRTQAEEVNTKLEEQLMELLSGHWPERDGNVVPLGDLCELTPGPNRMPRNLTGRQPTWVPLVLPRNIRNNRISADNLDTVPPVSEERNHRYQLRAGDIVSPRAGTLGRYGLVTSKQTGWLLGPGCVRLRPSDETRSDYLTYYLGSPVAYQWLMKHATGTAIQHVNTATLRKLPVWLPSLSVQDVIVGILDSFDSAARIHGQLNDTTGKLQDLVVAKLMQPSSNQ